MNIKVRGVCALLQVFDMPTSLRFYRDVLGFGVVQASASGDHPDWVWLRLDGAELMLNTAYEAHERPAIPDATRAVSHADTGLFFDCPDVDAAYLHLRSHGIEVGPPRVAPYGMKQLTLRDPDGYNLCFQCEAPAS